LIYLCPISANMKVTGFSFIRNAVNNDYPVVQAILSILPICDEFVIAVFLWLVLSPTNVNICGLQAVLGDASCYFVKLYPKDTPAKYGLRLPPGPIIGVQPIRIIKPFLTG